MEGTVERILLAESSYQGKTRDHCNTMEERLATQRTNDVLEKLTQKIAELESSLEGRTHCMNKTGKTITILKSTTEVQLTVDAGIVGKTIMRKSIVTLETNIIIQPITEETTLRRYSMKDIEDSKADSKTPSHIQNE